MSVKIDINHLSNFRNTNIDKKIGVDPASGGTIRDTPTQLLIVLKKINLYKV